MESKQEQELVLPDNQEFLPTGKPHVSYSELYDWIECSWRHRKKYVEKVDVDDGPSIHTEFGQVIHQAMEDYLLQDNYPRFPSKPESYVEDFNKRFNALVSDTSRFNNDEIAKMHKLYPEFIASIPKILADAPVWLDKQFPGWEVVSAEEKLYEPISGQETVKFKGFVDAFIKVPKRRKKRKPKSKKSSVVSRELSLEKMQEDVYGVSHPDHPDEDEYEVLEGQYEYYILDWKTTDWGWKAEKKRDFYKQLQIMLYKIFFCEKKEIPLKDIKCGFVLLKRKPNKTTGSHCELVMVSVGPKSVEKSMKTLNVMVNSVRSGRTLKNKRNCMFCAYKHTKHCI